jgi:hypothetical protein
MEITNISVSTSFLRGRLAKQLTLYRRCNTGATAQGPEHFHTHRNSLDLRPVLMFYFRCLLCFPSCVFQFSIQMLYVLLVSPSHLHAHPTVTSKTILHQYLQFPTPFIHLLFSYVDLEFELCM